MGVIPLLWFDGVRNVGDACSPLIVSALTNSPCLPVANLDSKHVVAVGSLLSLTNENSYIWGTGLGHPGTGVGCPKGSRVFAVRGKLSHAELRRAKIKLNDIPLGDPAILMPDILRIKRTNVPDFRLGFVAHYVDRAHPLFAELRRLDGVKEIDVSGDVKDFIQDMLSCANVVSSSLHGLILAEALGIPNAWVAVSDAVIGGGFKFADWFSTTRHPQRQPLTSTVTIGDILACCNLHEHLIDVRALLESFPAEAIAQFSCEMTLCPSFSNRELASGD